MGTGKKAQERESLREILRRLDGYETIKEESLDNLHYHAKCKIIENDVHVPVNILFVDNGIIFIEKNNGRRSMWFVKYINIVNSRIYDHRAEAYLKLSVHDSRKNIVCVLKDKNVAQKLIMMLKTKRDGRSAQSERSMCPETTRRLVSVIKFGNLRFLLRCSSRADFTAFRRKAIYRLGRHFYPNREIPETNIDLSEYTEFLFYVNHNGIHILLESDIDFCAAVDFFDGKLDVLITLKKIQDQVGPETIDILQNK